MRNRILRFVGVRISEETRFVIHRMVPSAAATGVVCMVFFFRAQKRLPQSGQNFAPGACL